ncbi:MAG: phosphoribosylamine--glycine ligase [Rickettsiales bacterium]
MNILVLGSGGREHAIAWSFSKSPLLTKLYVAPGNGGIEQIADCVSLDLTKFQDIVDFCLLKNIDLVMVGPEQPLSDGIVDFLNKHNIKVLGCNSFCAQLESSKSFTKTICDKVGVKTAAYKVFYELEAAIDYLHEQKNFPQVIKADGLAAGKGVIIAENIVEAVQAVREIFSGVYGDMHKIVIEEFLSGVEVSFFAISDGKDFKVLTNAGDHKRIGDNDTGPNTGGMGTYSPSPYVTKEVENEVIENILKPTFNYLNEQGHPYKGIIFAGLMINEANEPYLIEYNIRFGDPETQSILSRLKSDFLSICMAAAEGNLADHSVEFNDLKAVTLVLSAKGYPGKYKKGSEIKLPNIDNFTQVNIFHAGTKIVNGKLLADGGRVLNITATGNNYKDACEKVYLVAKQIKWKDKYYRNDIAKLVINK